MQRVNLPEPISGGLLLSYKCNAECRYCMYACSPRWEDWISEADLREILNQLVRRIRPSPYGPEKISLNHGLHFTGGEPFLKFDLLLRSVELASDLGIPSTFVETNCFWCSDDERTREKLRTLKEAGLRGTLISVNPFYLEHVPFERTKRGIRISREVFGENVMVYQLEYYTRFKRLEIEDRISLDDYMELEKEDLAKNVELFLMGRAAYELGSLYPKNPPDYFFNEPCRPSFLRDWHNHFDNYGNYLPGYCGGISLGDCRDLDELLEEGIDLDRHPVLRFLINQDFEGLFQFAMDFGYRKLGDGYVSKCHLCLDIRKHLLEEGEFEELRPKEFYSHLG